MTQYPTSAEYTAICQQLVARYSVLADTIGNEYVSTPISLPRPDQLVASHFFAPFSVVLFCVSMLQFIKGSWKMQLRQKMKNMRRPGPNGQKRSRDKGEEEQDKENQVKRVDIEMFLT